MEAQKFSNSLMYVNLERTYKEGELINLGTQEVASKGVISFLPEVGKSCIVGDFMTTMVIRIIENKETETIFETLNSKYLLKYSD